MILDAQKHSKTHPMWRCVVSLHISICFDILTSSESAKKHVENAIPWYQTSSEARGHIASFDAQKLWWQKFCLFFFGGELFCKFHPPPSPQRKKQQQCFGRSTDAANFFCWLERSDECNTISDAKFWTPKFGADFLNWRCTLCCPNFPVIVTNWTIIFLVDSYKPSFVTVAGKRMMPGMPVLLRPLSGGLRFKIDRYLIF